MCRVHPTRSSATEHRHPSPRRDVRYGRLVGATAEIAHEFTPAAEVIAEFHTTHEAFLSHAGSEAILELLRRRPCTTEGIADGLGIHRHEAIKCVEQLAAEGHVEEQWIAGNCYWKATRAAVEEPAGSSTNQGSRAGEAFDDERSSARRTG